MNLYDAGVLKKLLHEPFINQRMLSEISGHSLGSVNKSIKNLVAEGYLDNLNHPTDKVWEFLSASVPQNAVILAAGFGMRMVPINLSTSKGLIEINGEPLIERIIKQLRAAGIYGITIVVGFMKEQYEYLIDLYDVELVVNSDYSCKNNLHSLALVADRIQNTYVVPCDVWCDKNPFDKYELYSWYMVSDLMTENSDVRINRKMELAKTGEKHLGNTMIGISYLMGDEAKTVRNNLTMFDADGKHDDSFWEETLYTKNRMIVQGNVFKSKDVVEINTYEQLRDMDSSSRQLKSDALDTIAEVFETTTDRIVDISVLKKGMTNRSFFFSVDGGNYIMRIPGEGTERLIDRKHEVAVYKAISGLGFCDDPVYINSDNGYKITKFLEGVRPCDAFSVNDVKKCMEKLSDFHQMHITVSHTFDLFGKLEFYEGLRDGQASLYRDYQSTKAHVFELKQFVETTRTDWCLTHIDAVPDNFLFYVKGSNEVLQLADWEYAGMQDPHVDIAMFAIYSLYDKQQIDSLIELYFESSGEELTTLVKAKIYAYIAICGLLWSNWCEFKVHCGVEFGEYALRQYHYAKEYYRYAYELMEDIDD